MFRTISQSIKWKIVALVATVLVLSQLASFVTTYVNIQKSQKRNLEDGFQRAQQVFNNLVNSEKLRLANQAKLLGVLPLLVAVVETEDEETISDSVSGYIESLDLDFIEVYNSDGDILVVTDEVSSAHTKRYGAESIPKALGEGIDPTYAVRDGNLVILATHAVGSPPVSVGAMTIGVKVDDSFADQIKSLSGAEVTFILDGGVAASSLDDETRGMLMLSKGQRSEFSLGDYFIKKFELKGPQGVPIGEMYLQRSQAEENAFFRELLLFVGGVALVVLALFALIGVRFSKAVTAPLKALQDAATKIQTSLDYSIRAPEIGKDEGARLASAFNGLLSEIEKNHRELQDYSKNLESKVEQRTQELAESNAAMKALLENLDEGFFVFGPDGVVRPGSTKAAHKMFGMNPEGNKISDVFHIEDHAIKDIDDWRELLFGETRLDFESLVSVGPSAFTKLNDRHIAIQYRPIYGESNNLDGVICISSDRTNEKLLEAQAIKEKATVKLVMNVLQDKEAFLDFVSECRRLIADLQSYLQGEQELEIDTLFRFMHTIKGGCASYNFVEAADVAHKFENTLTDLRGQDNEKVRSFVPELIEGTQRIAELFEGVLEEHKDVIGDTSQEVQRVRTISEHLVQEIYSDLLQHVPEENQGIQLFKESLLLDDIAQMFSRYQKVVGRVAESQGKQVQFSIEGSSVYVLADPYKALVSACVHIFRNAVDHGIEDPMTREMAEKDPVASISINAHVVKGGLVIIIKDDGQGIDHQRIGSLAVDKQIVTEDELKEMSDVQIIQYIFHAGFSTKDEVTDLSGRGIGLDAVMFEAKELGGSVFVKSEIGVGSQFILKLPLIVDESIMVSRSA